MNKKEIQLVVVDSEEIIEKVKMYVEELRGEGIKEEDAICATCGEGLHIFKDNILVHGSAAMLERCQIIGARRQEGIRYGVK